MKNTKPNRRAFVQFAACAALAAVTCSASLLAAESTSAAAEFSFTVAGDMQQFASGAPAGKRYFDGACEAMRRVGAGSFLITPGDFNPPAPLRAAIDRYLGSDFPWYVVIGNHEFDAAGTLAWVRKWIAAGIPHVVRTGPPGVEFLYSFDVGGSHFVTINSYPDAKLGDKGKIDLSGASLDWLEQDLATTRQPLIWVIGHQPIESLPDIKVPSLVVVGADDTPFLAASDYMAAKIPGAQKVVIPAAGHAVNIDQPQAFIDAVLPFLDGLDAKATKKAAS